MAEPEPKVVRAVRPALMEHGHARGARTTCSVCGENASGRPYCVDHSEYAQQVARLVDQIRRRDSER